MTWTKLGAEFYDEMAHAGLSDAAARTHGEAVGYLYRVESKDLRIRRTLIPRFAGSDDWQQAVTELVTAGFWASEGASVRVLHHEDVIRASLVAQQNQRERNRKAQEGHRARKAAKSTADVPAHVSADVSDEVSAFTDRQTDKQAPRVSTVATTPEPWSHEELGQPSACRDCAAPLAGPVQLRNGRCNRCQVSAKASNVTPIAQAR